MAIQALKTASRILLISTLTVAVAACGMKNRRPSLLASDPVDSSRFGSGADIEYKGTYPRAIIPYGNLNPNAPSAYTVVKGDTLWDISGRFLTKPWYWPRIWDYNPQIQNPHLIYPGDVISIEYVDGQPALRLTRDGDQLGTGDPNGGGFDGSGGSGTAYEVAGANGRLSPRIRVESLNEAIPTIPADAIEQFLIRPNVVTKRQLRDAPYVIGNADDRLISALGQQIFVRGELNHNQSTYGIFRKTGQLRDPASGRLLGYEVTHVAEAKLLNLGDPSTMLISSNSRETIAGDLLLPSANDGMAHTYTPRMPGLNGEGRVVSLVDAISQSGRDQIITLNMGKDIGLQVGDVLAIESRGRSMIDRSGPRKFDRVRMPNQRTGVVMVFQTFDEVSYGLIMESTRPVKKNDIITGI